MTASWFNSDDRIQLLESSADKWHGTPFVPNGRVLGHGVSCQMLVEQVYRECGLGLESTAPSGPMGWSGVHKDSLIEPFLGTVEGLRQLQDTSDILVGDLLGFKLGSCVHHLGIVLTGGRILHSMRGLGTTYSLLSDPTYKSRIAKVWRWIYE